LPRKRPKKHVAAAAAQARHDRNDSWQNGTFAVWLGIPINQREEAMPTASLPEESTVFHATDCFGGHRPGRRRRPLAIGLELPDNAIDAFSILRTKWDAAYPIDMRALDCASIKLLPLVAMESRSLASKTIAAAAIEGAAIMRAFLLYWLAPPSIMLLVLLILAYSFR
jgi:hypothetical protein